MLGFSSVTVIPTSLNINDQTTYLVTLTLTQSLQNVPAGFRVVMVLPSRFGVVNSVGSLPSTCTLMDFLFLSPDINLTQVFNSASPQNGQCGVSASNTYTLITPQQMTAGLKFLIGSVKNPDASYNLANMGSIQFSGFNAGSTTANFQISYDFPSGTFTPGKMISTSFTQTSDKVGA